MHAASSQGQCPKRWRRRGAGVLPGPLVLGSQTRSARLGARRCFLAMKVILPPPLSQLWPGAVEIDSYSENQGCRPGVDGIELERLAAADDVGDEPDEKPDERHGSTSVSIGGLRERPTASITAFGSALEIYEDPVTWNWHCPEGLIECQPAFVGTPTPSSFVLPQRGHEEPKAMSPADCLSGQRDFGEEANQPIVVPVSSCKRRARAAA